MKRFQTGIHRRGLVTALGAGLAATLAAVTPAAATDAVVGTGNVSAAITYTTGSIPANVLPCGNSTIWSLSSSGGAAQTGGYIDLQGASYAGPMVITGTGTAPCDAGWGATGGISITLNDGNQGIVQNNHINCTLKGTWVRTGDVVNINMIVGSCVVNNITTVPNAAFLSVGVFTPSGGSNGVTTPTTSAGYTGPWVAEAAG
jgi:hypothetical protein